MSSNSPCAVYNFYNCCDPATASQSGSFIWLGDQPIGPANIGGSTPDVLGGTIALTAQPPDADLKRYLGMTPLHRSARLNDVSLIRFAAMSSGPAYTSTVLFNLVVLDFAGTVIRTISTASINYQGIPIRTWTPISLSTVPGDLDIPAGQLIAGQLVFGAPLATNQTLLMFYQLTGTGVLL